MTDHILIVDDERGILTALTGVLEDEGYTVSVAETGKGALRKMEEDPSVVLLDIWLPDMDGLNVLEEIKRRCKDTVVIVMSGHGTIETAVRATKLGAYDYVEKPISMERIILLIRHALEQRQLELENVHLKNKYARCHEIIGISPPIQKLKESLKAVAPTNSIVLITGENGTGKELVARAIHAMSPRANRLFLAVNCAAIPDTLIESELFGHEKGAFTGATSVQRGKFELAHGGTLFLDEIGDMSLNTQAKVLRVLQEQEFQRVGGTRNIKVDARVISATNKDLLKEIGAGRFREDLYFRINVITIHIPPLRERKEDIPLLARHFLREISKEHGIPEKELTHEAIELMQEYDWPGNVRELRNLMERVSIMIPGDTIMADDLAIISDGHRHKKNRYFIPGKYGSLREARSNFERYYIEECLRANNWNITKTAQDLQIERSNLHRKIKILGIRIQEMKN